ncbi:DUF4401 domain-containing protein [Sphingobacterium rhinopitheci]|uniref:DUF4401 domain-containing protein n=1 Tax=Sphingobacterium rhinopitheci TaxID=2781960 RepID=UPI001F5255E7|nr:DUF4401 domain-containing protein [Sphingobacterium rhinopitheci]MCI0921362.1 DUF4401 domain-containing protein [Sphingobacterium rhinopitheci]
MNNNRSATSIEYLKSIAKKPFLVDEEAVSSAYASSSKEQQTMVIKALTIFGALLTCVFGIGFLFLIGIYDYPLFMIGLGILLIIIPSYLTTQVHETFLDTFLLSLYCTGYGLLAFGMSQAQIDIKVILICLLVVATFTLIYLNNYVIALIATLIIYGCIEFLLKEFDLYQLFPFFYNGIAILTLFILTKEAKIISYSKHLAKIYEPLKIASIVFYIYKLNGWSTFNLRTFQVLEIDSYSFNIFSYSITLVVTIGLFFYLITKILQQLTITNRKQKAIIYSAALIVLLPSTIQPNIPGALLLILSCFYINYKTGIALGILSFLYFITRFYYDMEVTLLFKSIILMLTGFLFLLVYYLTSKNLSAHEKS